MLTVPHHSGRPAGIPHPSYSFPGPPTSEATVHLATTCVCALQAGAYLLWQKQGDSRFTNPLCWQSVPTTGSSRTRVCAQLQNVLWIETYLLPPPFIQSLLILSYTNGFQSLTGQSFHCKPPRVLWGGGKGRNISCFCHWLIFSPLKHCVTNALGTW